MGRRKGSDKSSKQVRSSLWQRPRGSYNPDWYKKSAIIIPDDGSPVPNNPIVDAIMGIDRSSSQTVEVSPEDSTRGKSSS